jgi:hypothetical protein
MLTIARTGRVLAGLAGGVLLVAGLVGVATPASAAPPPPARTQTIGYSVLFQNANSGKCLEMLNYSTANFAPAGQWSCHGDVNQQWNYNTDTGLIQNVNSGKCLEVLNYSTANGAQVGQWDCYGGQNQKWWLNPSTGLIQNQYSGKCLEVLNYSTANFAPVGQWDCYGGANQVWGWRH